MARNSRFDGLMVPTMRAAQRVRNKVGLYFDRRTDTPLVQRRDGSTVELGRLNIEEQGVSAGDMLCLRQDGRYRSGPLAHGWRAHARGIVMWEDFIGHSSVSADFERYWNKSKTGVGGVMSKVADNQASQRGKCAGVLEVKIADGSTIPCNHRFWLGHNTGGGASGSDTIVTPLPDDTWCVAKMRITAGSTEMSVWAGIQDHAGRWPDDDASYLHIRHIGFLYRARGSGVNWHGLVRNGVSGGSPDETLVDLGVAGNDTWHEFAWNYRSTGPKKGVQFYLDGTAVGSVVTTNLPPDAYGLSPHFGCNGTSSTEETTDGDKAMQIDYFGLFAPSGPRW